MCKNLEFVCTVFVNCVPLTPMYLVSTYAHRRSCAPNVIAEQPVQCLTTEKRNKQTCFESQNYEPYLVL